MSDYFNLALWRLFTLQPPSRQGRMVQDFLTELTFLHGIGVPPPLAQTPHLNLDGWSGGDRLDRPSQ